MTLCADDARHLTSHLSQRVTALLLTLHSLHAHHPECLAIDVTALPIADKERNLPKAQPLPHDASRGAAIHSGYFPGQAGVCNARRTQVGASDLSTSLLRHKQRERIFAQRANHLSVCDFQRRQLRNSQCRCNHLWAGQLDEVVRAGPLWDTAFPSKDQDLAGARQKGRLLELVIAVLVPLVRSLLPVEHDFQRSCILTSVGAVAIDQPAVLHGAADRLRLRFVVFCAQLARRYRMPRAHRKSGALELGNTGTRCLDQHHTTAVATCDGLGEKSRCCRGSCNKPNNPQGHPWRHV
mmetsp:Transcript_112670/g.358040  ORF Transcript_112670/g.358040 Transcript_112670/m.358040 type:complete len:295 (-) Transcript_112670:275-1159(-)